MHSQLIRHKSLKPILFGMLINQGVNFCFKMKFDLIFNTDSKFLPAKKKKHEKKLNSIENKIAENISV